ncbi:MULTISPECIES: alpha/beta fold hydrolase [Micromonospora]|uniref:Pimeloyl-ACP methyl ester carboxylesterase n=1 Tax=Micromonospora yangpuensis TaxID=683228 RepID=A0A1C6UKS6_9ACTN|nr:alpha/beta hydrolase [Micromonospora yangpuensis]GGM16869.1 arylesterase [Micromonospora yangpuensis]SCL54453.1 Pimeloyl-ACP methyl ester carboxylesterase [Micromonospora yangpuensis]
MPYVSASDGTALFYADTDGEHPVVFLSSASMGIRWWDAHVPGLVARGRRCVRYDRRGHGRSDWPWRGYDYDTLADDLHQLIEHLDLRDVTLVGYAMGGGEAVRYLTRHGAQRVRRLMLVASTTPVLLQSPGNPDGVPPEVVEGLLAALQADRPRLLAETAAPFLVGAPGTATDLPLSPEMVQWICQLSLECSLHANVEVYRTLYTTDLSEDVRAVTVPTLVVHGDRDLAAPLALCGERTARDIPDSKLLVYPGAAHGLAVTHSARLTADLLAFTTD